ncbi:GNAT family N-acetyltransferase [Rhodococcus sp. X156]|uniref:GNAT family N-acetyltransferase n=1 Tax=Rhodococcus sp. X156 TaxID=2499145 RepID=UPI000FDB8737|nr:GNAT family N-acetyltransferase [Rhodococcus sp. X156]
MEPIEINAGTWYLRALRADERVDDCATLLTTANDPATLRHAPELVVRTREEAVASVARRVAQWADETGFSWAVCEPTTGEMLAEVRLRNVDHTHRSAELACWTAPAHRRRGVMGTAAGAVTRLALAPERLGGLGLHRLSYLHTADNPAAAAIALGCGMTAEGRLRQAALLDDQWQDVLLHARLATD